jgi:integrase
MSVYFDKRNGRWRFSFNQVVSGNRIRVTKLLPETWNRNQAKAFDQSETARLFGTATGSIKQRFLIGEAVVAYCQHQLPKLKGGAEIEKELARIHGYYENRFIDELADVAREYVDAERDRVSAATMRNKLSYLRAACRYAKKFHRMGDVPDISLPVVRNERKEYINRKEMLMIARKCQDRLARALIRLAFYSGMRLGEMMSLGNTSKVLDDGFHLIDTKNGEDRFSPMHPKIKIVCRFLPIPFSKIWMQRLIRRAMDKAGFTDLRLHDLRHSTASSLINAGADFFTVGAVLGHKDMRSTKRYSHLAKQTLNNAILKIK